MLRDICNQAHGRGIAFDMKFLFADADGAEPVIDIHQHTNYHGRSDDQLVAHQHTMGISKSVLLPAGSKYGLAAGCGGNDTVVKLAKEHPGMFVFFANELPDIPAAKPVIEKYLNAGAIGQSCAGQCQESAT